MLALSEAPLGNESRRPLPDVFVVAAAEHAHPPARLDERADGNESHRMAPFTGFGGGERFVRVAAHPVVNVAVVVHTAKGPAVIFPVGAKVSSGKEKRQTHGGDENGAGAPLQPRRG